MYSKLKYKYKIVWKGSWKTTFAVYKTERNSSQILIWDKPSLLWVSGIDGKSVQRHTLVWSGYDMAFKRNTAKSDVEIVYLHYVYLENKSRFTQNTMLFYFYFEWKNICPFGRDKTT